MLRAGGVDSKAPYTEFYLRLFGVRDAVAVKQL